MFNPFREHFWRHVWDPWSEPFVGVITNPPSRKGDEVDCQERKCRVCGAIDRRIL